MSDNAAMVRARSKVDQLGQLRQAFGDGLLDQLGPFATRRFHRYRLIGMGQSFLAAAAAAARMRSLGLNAAAELASSTDGFPMNQETLTIAVTASGQTAEVLRTLDRLDGHFPVLVVTNQPASAVANRAGVVLPLHAGVGSDPLCLNTFPHTALILQSLAVVFSGGLPRMVRHDLTGLIDDVAAAWAALQDSTPLWLDDAAERLSGPAGVIAMSPTERSCSAAHSAQVLRQGAGLPSWAYDTADYCHSGPTSARASTPQPATLLYTGSRYDRQAVARLATQGSAIVAVGSGAPKAMDANGKPPVVVRYPDDDDAKLARFAESHVADLVAAQNGTGSTPLAR